MLTPEQFEAIGRQASSLYTELELEIIEEISTRIANVGYANTVALNSAMLAQEMGYTYGEVISLVAKYNNQAEEEIRQIFENAGVQTLKFDDSIYKEAGLNPMPIQKSKRIIQLLEATAVKTNNNLNNLVMTTANTSQTQFYNAMNKAYMEVSTGLKSYSQAIIEAINEVSKQGALVEYPSGRKINVESAVRMNITTGVNQTCGKLQLLRAHELEWDLMELTAHAGARPTHAEWQGRIVSLSGKSGYLSLDDIGYGEVTGFKGVNCNHDWMPFSKGSTRTYTNQELEKMANEKVIYNGQKISRYDAMQMQRKMERQIRQDKRDIAGLQGILTSTAKDDELLTRARTSLDNMKIKAKQHNIELNDFLTQTKFRKDYTRLQIGKIGVTNDVKDDIIAKKLKKEEKMNYQDITNKYSNKKEYQVVKQKYFISDDGTKYNVDGRHVLLKTNHEETEVANILGETLGGKVKLVPVVLEPKNIQTPDYIINNEKFDLKQIIGNGKNTLDTAINKKKKQSDNFVFDITKTEMSIEQALLQIERIYNAKNRTWVNTVILIKDKKVLKVFKRR